MLVDALVTSCPLTKVIVVIISRARIVGPHFTSFTFLRITSSFQHTIMLVSYLTEFSELIKGTLSLLVQKITTVVFEKIGPSQLPSSDSSKNGASRFIHGGKAPFVSV